MATGAVATSEASVVDGGDRGGCDGTTQERTSVNARSKKGRLPSAMKVSVTLPLLYLSLVYVGNHVMAMDLVRCVLTRVMVVCCTLFKD